MPRLARHVVASPRTSSAHDDSTERPARRLQAHTQTTTASPVRKMNGRSRQQQQRRPRESLLEEDSIISNSDSDDSHSVASPYTPRPQENPATTKIANGKQKAQKERLQKAAVHNAARRSLGLQHANSHTPRQIPLRDDDASSDLPVVGTALTPASKRPMPILSNFEDWLKLATENKINVNNSWNFALIDYFHEMSLLKDDSGRGINFQKASCTLDGCVKIYVGRVESVGVEAGRLLSGLANSNSEDEPKKKKRRGEDDEEGEEGEDGSGDEDEEGGKKKEKKRKARSHEATLAPSFASLQLKKLELEFAVDPLFKKASADFDQGGAKGLLLNHLCIDEVGRIVFDSSDDAVDTEKSTNKDNETDEPTEATQTDGSRSQSEQPSSQDPQLEDNVEIDIASLGAKFFPSLLNLDSLDICPSMKNFRVGDPNATIPLLSGNPDWKDSSKSKSPEKSQPPPLIPLDGDLADQSGLFLDDNNAGLDFDDDDDAGGFAFGMGDDVEFGQGGEAWAKEAAAHPGLRPVNATFDDDNQDADGDGYAVSMQHRYQEDIESETMLAFFGKAFNSRAKVGTKVFENLTNWRIARIQKQQQAESAPPTRQRKEKEPFVIDFHGATSENLKRLLAEPRVANDKISLPKSQLKTKGKNLLDQSDTVIDVKSLMRLWTKPKCRVIRRRNGPAVVDEGFGGKGREAPRLNNERNDMDDEDEVPAAGDYDANFFADDEPLPFFDGPLPIDDDFDDDEAGDQPGFVDAREMLSPQPESGDQLQQNLNQLLNNDDHPPDSQDDPNQPQYPATQTDPAQNLLPGSFGSQLVTQAGRRLRPEYVNFARVAKKVDVRALKENMWKGMATQLDFSLSNISASTTTTPPLTDAETETDTDGDGDTEMMDIDDYPPLPIPPQSDNQEPQTSTLKFTQILTNLKTVYPEPQMKDISTSYGFICLLHLANEKGLVLEGGREEGGMEEILVRRDLGVGEGYVGE